MKIILDAMGGDNAPAEILKGAAAAVSQWPDLSITAVGKEAVIRNCAKENSISLDKIEIVNAEEVIEMCDEPARAIRSKKDSSIVVGLRLLADGKGDAFVSAGSTGALHVGTSLIVRTVKGVKRPALASILPGKTPFLLLDCGANVECRPQMLEAFGVMGSVYMQQVMGVEKPRVALVNNGAEETKGTPVYVEAHKLLKENTQIHFVGNIEAREIPQGGADVVVADGFTGNVVLKLTEGLAKFFGAKLKTMFKKSLGTKLGYLLVKGGVKEFKQSMDADEYGGAPFLGAAKPVIKAHGSSNARAIQNAIRQAKLCVENDLCGVMAKNLAAQTESQEG